ncbi:hypothetical protein LCM19_09055 [Qipengyuania flava]|nr:hypothetical protein [Qipengyuania flava]
MVLNFRSRDSTQKLSKGDYTVKTIDQARKHLVLEDRKGHLEETHISATRFGRRAVGDPRFVLDLRAGRQPRRRTVEKVERYLSHVPRLKKQPD